LQDTLLLTVKVTNRLNIFFPIAFHSKQSMPEIQHPSLSVPIPEQNHQSDCLYKGNSDIPFFAVETTSEDETIQLFHMAHVAGLVFIRPVLRILKTIQI